MTNFVIYNYCIFLRSYIKKLPKGGRGEINKIAIYVGVHSSLLSQILSEEKNLSLDSSSDSNT